MIDLVSQIKLNTAKRYPRMLCLYHKYLHSYSHLQISVSEYRLSARYSKWHICTPLLTSIEYSGKTYHYSFAICIVYCSIFVIAGRLPER